MSETSEKPEPPAPPPEPPPPIAAALGCSPEEGSRGEGGEETSENGGGAVAVGVLDAIPPSALSPVAEEPTGDTKKKSKPARGGKITCREGKGGAGGGELAVVDIAAFFHIYNFLLIVTLSAL